MRRTAGYSMVELLLTVVFVTLGTMMIQGGFLKAAEVFGRYGHTLKSMLWTDEGLARIREAVLRDEYENEESGVLRTQDRDFQWTREVRMLGEPNLFSLRSIVSWTESGKPLTLSKETYVYKKDLLQGPG